jgi:hypothetical protein
MKFNELLRREALAACAAASLLSLPALAIASETAPLDQHHGNKRLMREMAKSSGDPTGEVAVPHSRDVAAPRVMVRASAPTRTVNETDRFKAPDNPLDMRLYRFKDE